MSACPVDQPEGLQLQPKESQKYKSGRERRSPALAKQKQTEFHNTWCTTMNPLGKLLGNALDMHGSTVDVSSTVGPVKYLGLYFRSGSFERPLQNLHARRAAFDDDA